MKYVRLNDENKIIEILPNNMTSLEIIKHWYGQDFALKCIQAPDNISENMYYENGEFIEETESETYKIKAARQRMEVIKSLLSELDYKTLKYIDGDITEREYAPFKNQRAELRAEYRQIEAKYGKEI